MIDAHMLRPPLSAVIIGDRATPLALAGAAAARAWKGMKAPPPSGIFDAGACAVVFMVWSSFLPVVRLSI